MIYPVRFTPRTGITSHLASFHVNIKGRVADREVAANFLLGFFYLGIHLVLLLSQSNKCFKESKRARRQWPDKVFGFIPVTSLWTHSTDLPTPLVFVIEAVHKDLNSSKSRGKDVSQVGTEICQEWHPTYLVYKALSDQGETISLFIHPHWEAPLTAHFQP